MSVPYVIEQDEKGNEKVYDLPSRLLRDRVVFIKGEFNQHMADSVVAQLLFLESSDPDKDINLYINSPGGEITAMFSIFDTMNYIKPDICSLAYGQACSAASFILAGSTKGKRYILKNSTLMLHELSSGTQGKFHDMEISFNRSKYLYNKMADYYAEFTGKPVEDLKEDMKKDFYMTAEEAVEYGIVDKIQVSR